MEREVITRSKNKNNDKKNDRNNPVQPERFGDWGGVEDRCKVESMHLFAWQMIAPKALPLQERLNVNLSHLHRLDSVRSTTEGSSQAERESQHRDRT